MPCFSIKLVRSSSDFDLRLSTNAAIAARRSSETSCLDFGNEPVLGRNGQERGAEQRIDARREHFDRARGSRRSRTRTRTPSLRPIQLRCIVRVRSGHPSSFVRSSSRRSAIGGDLEEPLRQVAALDQVLAAPAAPVDHLLVREHGMIVRAPVHRRFALVSQAALVQAQEQPLVPAIVLGLARRDLARPVVTGSHQPDLAPHVAGCSRRSTPQGRLRARWRRSRPEARTRPSPSDAARRIPACASSAPTASPRV